MLGSRMLGSRMLGSRMLGRTLVGPLNQNVYAVLLGFYTRKSVTQGLYCPI